MTSAPIFKLKKWNKESLRIHMINIYGFLLIFMLDNMS